jgi:hypothetical protein
MPGKAMEDIIARRKVDLEWYLDEPFVSRLVRASLREDIMYNRASRSKKQEPH